MEVEQMIQLFNQEHKSLKEIGEIAGISKSTVQRRIVSAGYVFDKEKNVYVSSNVSRETIYNSNINKSTNHKIDSSDNVSIETPLNDKMVNGSYTIPASLARALKFKAVSENKKVVDIVREALEKCVDDKYFNM